MVIRSLDDFAHLLADIPRDLLYGGDTACEGPDGRIIICGHRNPDGDCLGSELALAIALRAAGFKAVPLISGDKNPDDLYAFLPGFDLFVPADGFPGEADLAIALDVPGTDRMGKAGEAFARAHRTAGIDHHPDTVDYADLTFSDPTAAAAGMLVWDLLEILGLERGCDVATCAYVALMTDTGRFQFQNTDGRALRYAGAFVDAGADPASCARSVYQNRTLAAMRLEETVISHAAFLDGGRFAYSWITDEDMERFGARKDDTEGLSDVLRSIRGVEISLLMHIHPDEVRGSLRAKGDQDVATCARALGGGGHKAAAGFNFHGSREEAVAAVAKCLGIETSRS